MCALRLVNLTTRRLTESISTFLESANITWLKIVVAAIVFKFKCQMTRNARAFHTAAVKLTSILAKPLLRYSHAHILQKVDYELLYIISHLLLSF